MTNVLQIAAPAKVNLALWVGPVGPDGMHPICSWMVTVDLCDELTLHQLEAGRLSRYAILWHEDALQKTEIDWSIKKDLAVRAHLALQSHVGRDLPIQMKLEKRIPVGGGLGGGSSDAAATLRGVNMLFDLGLSTDELAQIGAAIGADIPFLVEGGSALVEGIGETVTTQEKLPSISVALFFPDVMCDTGQVYKAFDKRPGSLHSPEDIRELINTTPEPSHPFNDLAQPACDVVPALNIAIDQITEVAECPVHVSGSGSSLFVICDNQMHAEALVGTVQQRLNIPGVAAQAVQGDPSMPLRGV